MRLLRAPGVYAPQDDTDLLVEAMHAAAIPAGARVLDIGTGTGALAIAAIRAGAAEVTGVDISRRAVWTARVNAALQRLPLRVKLGNALEVVADERFDLVLSNPPYVPAANACAATGPARAWDAGLDGRQLLDPLCARMVELLAPGGVLLMVHSVLCGVDTTLRQLRDTGLKASVVQRRSIPFGPVMRGRIGFLEQHGLIEPGQRHEELVVIRGDRPERPRGDGGAERAGAR
ncbi:HemK2/MTQ2 family protein methyltransferase [Lentzea sp.]|uniref:HemK2/MTQ2 family protein methyltransferase n=1 Tax=Lentzea sp. TaxID=56099 RepID=UPI002B984B9A|nr:HemK2/MTQ2 family protein methyltransferase [Lentzea sp.]HUQ61806.1 HemK2/MTQ2 family protein methyltransferase [Lentzea sp.]